MTTQAVKQILNQYESDTPGVLNNLAQVLNWGRSGGSGRMVILPVDQGFEHGPDRSFGGNPEAYDPHYHFRLAVEGETSAFAAPLGMLEAGARTFAGQIPLILKINSGNTLTQAPNGPDQAVTGSVQDALRLGCVGIGFTIYPGSASTYNQMEEIREMIREAKAHGLFTVIWSYPRGDLSKKGEQAIDVISYGAHMACLLGAHIVKVKLPTDVLERSEIAPHFKAHDIKIETLTERVALVRKSCFEGRRLVVFSGGPAQDDEGVMEEARAIKEGGGNGSIIGRNAFQRPFNQGVELLKGLGSYFQQ